MPPEKDIRILSQIRFKPVAKFQYAVKPEARYLQGRRGILQATHFDGIL